MHTLLYAAFLEDPLTWALLALGRRWRPRCGRPAEAEPKPSRELVAPATSSPEADGCGRETARERVAGAAAPRRGAVLWWLLVPTLSELRRLLPPRLGPGAARRAHSRRSRPTRRRRSTRSTSRCAALVGLVRGGRGPRCSCSLRCCALVALVWGTCRLGPGAASALAGAAGGALRRLELRVPALRGARRTSTCRSWRSSCGRPCSRPRARRGAPRWRCSCSPGCCARRRWVLAGLLWLWRWPAADAGRRLRDLLARPRRAADLVPRRPRRHRRPAALAARHERAGRRAGPRARDRDGAGLVRLVQLADVAPAGGARRRSIGACPRVAADSAGARCTIPAGAARRRRRHVRRHRRARAVDPAALPDGPGRRALPFAGYARARFTPLPAGPAAQRCGARPPSARWSSALGVPRREASVVRDARRRAALRPRSTHDDLVALLDDPGVRAGMALRAADVPELPARARHALDAGRAAHRPSAPAAHGAATPASRSSSSGDKALRRYGFADGATRGDEPAGPGLRRRSRARGCLARVRGAVSRDAQRSHSIPSASQPLPQRRVLRSRGLLERPRRAARGRAHARAGLLAQRRDERVGVRGGRHRALPRAHARESAARPSGGRGGRT